MLSLSTNHLINLWRRGAWKFSWKDDVMDHRPNGHGGSGMGYARGLCRGHCDFGRGPHYRTVFARWAIQPPTDPHRHQYSRAHKPAVLHYELPMEKKVPWNGAVSMRSRAGSWETLSICITLRHNQGAPADMHANALGFLIICRFPLP